MYSDSACLYVSNVTKNELKQILKKNTDIEKIQPYVFFVLEKCVTDFKNTYKTPGDIKSQIFDYFDSIANGNEEKTFYIKEKDNGFCVYSYLFENDSMNELAKKISSEKSSDIIAYIQSYNGVLTIALFENGKCESLVSIPYYSKCTFRNIEKTERLFGVSKDTMKNLITQYCDDGEVLGQALEDSVDSWLFRNYSDAQENNLEVIELFSDMLN